MRTNVACSDGDIDLQVLHWTINLVFLDSMRPESGDLASYVCGLSSTSTEIIFLPQSKQETKTKTVFPENCSQLTGTERFVRQCEH